jgi:oxygen-dependent protoporphyrinogen oxidase
MERRFGREVYERMIEPLMSGIYAGDGTQLSLEATFPQLRRMEVRWGSLVAGMRGAQRERGATPSALPSFLTPVGGMGELVEAVRRTLPANATRTGMFARKIERTAAGYRVELHDGAALEAGAVIVATPAHIAAELTAGLDADLSADLGAIPHVSSATVSLGYARAAIPRPLDGYGYIVPRREGRPVLAMTWTSSKFAHRAPEGFGLIRVFLAGAGREAILAGTDDHLVEAARHEARETLGITAEPAARRVFRWPLGMPQYVLGHLERVARIEGRAGAHAGLFLAGNAFRGVGIPDCIASGEAAAARAIERQAAGGSRRALGALEPRGSR